SHRGARAMTVYNYTTLDDPLTEGDLGTQATGINDAGQIVGTYTTGSTFHSFLLSGGTYSTIDDPSAGQRGPSSGTNVQGINDAGQIVGYYDDGKIDRGFLLSGGTYTTIDRGLFVFGTQLLGINALGQIVGGFTDIANNDHGFFLTNGIFATL